jgi:carboxypeptidase Taq
VAASSYEQLIAHWSQIRLLGSTAALLGWDQETKMPPGGVEHRTQQLSLLSTMSHERVTDARVGEWLEACESDASLIEAPDGRASTNLIEIRRDYDKATKLPAALVKEFSETTSKAKHEWAEARKANDFKRFEPWLAKVIELNRQRAECYGYEAEAWDGLADDFEPGCTAAWVADVFAPLRVDLVDLVGRLTGSGKQPSNRLNEFKLPVPQQEKFVRYVVEQFGFDFKRGRLDESTHPFCSGTCRDDIRMTTRFHEDMVNDALGSTMHEAGHGIYEQNLPAAWAGEPASDAVSLSIHESQSRLWENQVGRSRPFWTWCHKQMGAHFGSGIGDLSVKEAYEGANRVERSLIRVEADEATYNLHIMIRFELERAMLGGDLNAADVPGAWAEKYKAYLDLDVPDDRQGCLQDIHWSMGAMGYFPTYTLGNLYGAAFFETAQTQISDLTEQISRGEFDALRHWLTDNIHIHGCRYRSQQLAERVTGHGLDAAPLMRYLTGKLEPIYGL